MFHCDQRVGALVLRLSRLLIKSVPDYRVLSAAFCTKNNLFSSPSRRYTSVTATMYQEYKSGEQKAKNPFVTVEWLKKKLDTDAAGIRLLDCQWHMPNTKRVGLDEYKAKHIPGALFFDMEECSDKENEIDHMLPKPEQFAEYVGKLGINNKTHVVLYDNNENFGLFSAQRIWWTFRIFGHDDSFISILNGGFPAWLKAGYESTEAVPSVEAQSYTASFKPHLVKSIDDVKSILKEGQVTVLDARPSGRFQGTAPEPRAEIKSGHMPGAKNLPFLNMFDKEKKMFRSPEEIKKQFEDAGIDLSKPLVVTCGSGVSACMLALGAYTCGNQDVAVYDGSWTEWYQKAAPEEMENVPE